MFYLDLATNGRAETLCFASRKYALNFANFIKAYVDDSGAGNGYDAYWLDLDAKPYWRPYRLRKSGSELDPVMITSMLTSILRARLAVREPPLISWSWMNTDHGAVFWTDTLPPRQRPGVGDMYRIPRSKMSADASIRYCAEGRVLEDHDGVLFIRACQDEDPATGEWRNGKAKINIIDVDRTMKINDWLLDMRLPLTEEHK